MAGKTFLRVWLTIQWLVTLPTVPAFFYMFTYSDTHGFPGTAFYPWTLIILVPLTIGYAFALRVLQSWPEGA